MPSELALRLLGDPRQGPIRSALGRALTTFNRVTGRARYDRERLERVHGTSLMILPSVFNPRVLRTGAFFAEVIAAHRLGAGGDVLDLGTGSGICAVFAARHARRVVAVDINRTAVQCATHNAAFNGLAARIECRHGDLFAPVAGERFDAVFFNPPYIVGAPASERDAAWRSLDGASRFAAGLDSHLAPNGRAYLLLSTWGDACAGYVEELARQGFALSVHSVRRFVNERVTLVEAARPEARHGP
jgi:methylase of polypeptide subunit release factors